MQPHRTSHLLLLDAEAIYYPNSLQTVENIVDYAAHMWTVIQNSQLIVMQNIIIYK